MQETHTPIDTMEQITAQHTPGPWCVRCNDLVYADTRFIADCERTDKSKRPAPPDVEDAANARLIAAAPELLEALIRAVTRQGFINEELIKARAAIRKATQD